MGIQRVNAGSGGHTLIELMFALVIIAISVLALYQMFVTGSGMITEEYHRRVAMEKVQAIYAKMQYYSATLDSIPRGISGRHFEVLIPPSEEHPKGITATYTFKIEHSMDRDENNKPVFSSVDGDYSWTDWSGRQLSVPIHSKF
jgi:prepilin-type N-terminal cleavage/methylation domain-containing protein